MPEQSSYREFNLDKFVFDGKTHDEIMLLNVELGKLKLKAQDYLDTVLREVTALRNRKDSIGLAFSKRIRAKEEEERQWKKVIRSIATLHAEGDRKYWKAKE